jgi:hypothetical protein
MTQVQELAILYKLVLWDMLRKRKKGLNLCDIGVKKALLAPCGVVDVERVVVVAEA